MKEKFEKYKAKIKKRPFVRFGMGINGYFLTVSTLIIAFTLMSIIAIL